MVGSTRKDVDLSHWIGIKKFVIVTTNNDIKNLLCLCFLVICLLLTIYFLLLFFLGSSQIIGFCFIGLQVEEILISYCFSRLKIYALMIINNERATIVVLRVNLGHDFMCKKEETSGKVKISNYQKGFWDI